MKHLKFDLLCTFAVLCGLLTILSVQQAIELECNGLLILAGLTTLVMWLCIYEASQESRDQHKNQ